MKSENLNFLEPSGPPQACNGNAFYSAYCHNHAIFLPPVTQDVPELRRRIIPAISEFDRDVLQRVRAEMNYRLAVCRVTNGRHIE